VLWVAVGAIVLALVVLGLVGYGVLGAGARLQKELLAAEQDLAPVLAQAQARAAARARAGDDPAVDAG
jgi:hypothetical protein